MRMIEEPFEEPHIRLRKMQYMRFRCGFLKEMSYGN